VQDFLKVDPLTSRFQHVRAVLLDPSCSGSGTATACLDFWTAQHSAGLAHPCAPAPQRKGTVPHEQPTLAQPPRSSSQKQAQGGLPGNSSSCPIEPECGGSATGFPGKVSDDSERVRALANFQVTILQHALRFPNLQRLVYSTCSVFREENEDVVAKVLPGAHKLGFTLETALPQWPRRGLEGSYTWSQQVARVHPSLDQADGFFLALFVRE
jgi:16S rRNA C967 or C1407 C5-methylase (RsmB/RsmF family)